MAIFIALHEIDSADDVNGRLTYININHITALRQAKTANGEELKATRLTLSHDKTIFVKEPLDYIVPLIDVRSKV